MTGNERTQVKTYFLPWCQTALSFGTTFSQPLNFRISTHMCICVSCPLESSDSKDPEFILRQIPLMAAVTLDLCFC